MAAEVHGVLAVEGACQNMPGFLTQEAATATLPGGPMQTGPFHHPGLGQCSAFCGPVFCAPLWTHSGMKQTRRYDGHLNGEACEGCCAKTASASVGAHSSTRACMQLILAKRHSPTDRYAPATS